MGINRMTTTIDYESLCGMEVIPLGTLKSKLKSCDLIFCSGLYPFSSLIRQATNSLWSHVGVIFQLEDWGDAFVIESIETIGVRILPLSRFFTDYRDHQPYFGKCVIARPMLPEAFSVRDALSFGVNHLGSLYDTEENLRIAWQFFAGKPSFVSNDRYNCAELAAAILKYGGLTFSASPKTPETLWQSCRLEILGRIR